MKIVARLLCGLTRVAGVAGIAISVLSPDMLSAQEKTLNVMTFGGTLGKGFIQGVEGFESKYGIKIRVVEATGPQGLTRLLARAGQAPEFDIAMMSPSGHYQGAQAGLWEEITAKDVPTVADLLPVAYESGKYVGFGTLAYGVQVNTEALQKAGAPVPSKWTDLWNPAYRDRIVVQDFANSYGQAFFEAIYQINGKDVDKTFAELKKLRANVCCFSFSPAETDNYLLQQEAWISPTTDSRANLQIQQGAPVKFIYPDEGAGAWLIYLNVPKNSPRRAEAMKFLDYVLSPEVQKKLAVSAQVGPVNTKVELTPEEAKGLAYGEEARRKLRPIDWGGVLTDLDALNNRWVTEFQN
jgi:putative spermidine/putrescine transport system substrate-binding protein